MPVQYEGIRQEHVNVRTNAGLFDVSHMGEIETSGPDAEAFLQRILSNDVSKLAERGAQYSVLCRDDGGVLDDLFTYRLEDGFLTVTNAANHERDFDWFQRHAEGFDVTVTDAAASYAMLALQGPPAPLGVSSPLPATALDGAHTPKEAGPGGVCKREPGFTGSAALPDAPPQRLVPFAFTGPGIPRPGNAVVIEDEQRGLVTSGTFS